MSTFRGSTVPCCPEGQVDAVSTYVHTVQHYQYKHEEVGGKVCVVPQLPEVLGGVPVQVDQLILQVLPLLHQVSWQVTEVVSKRLCPQLPVFLLQQ